MAGEGGAGPVSRPVRDTGLVTGFGTGATMGAVRPNILVIMADQHAPQVSGPYGHPLVRTPAMDRLAAEGVTFDAACSPSPICVPARMSFMTGRRTSSIGIWDNGVPLREEAITWAHRLRRAGYRVALSGKMHFRGRDQLHGFEEQLAVDINALNEPSPPDWSQPLEPARPVRREMRRGPGRTPEIEADERAGAAAVRYLGSPERAAGPWALCVGFVAPHAPFVAPQRFHDLYADSVVDLPASPAEKPSGRHPFVRRYRQARGIELPPQVLREVRRSYYALTSFLDEQIGLLLTALAESGQLDETVVVYTADHGEMLGEHGPWHKCCFYEPSVRVPLLIRWPKRFPAGSRVAQPVTLLDLTATLLDLAEAPAGGAPVDGLNLTALADQNGAGDGGPADWPDVVFSEFYANYSTAPMAMARRARHKLCCYHGEEPQLFDLVQDPGESVDLAADMPTVRKDLLDRLLEWWDPTAVGERVRASQAERRYLAPYLFDYLKGSSR